MVTDAMNGSCLQQGADETPDVVGMFRTVDGSPFDQPLGSGVDPNDVPADSLTNWGLSEACTPRPGVFVTIKKNTLTASLSEAIAAGYSSGKAYANAQARDYLRAQMNLFLRCR